MGDGELLPFGLLEVQRHLKRLYNRDWLFPLAQETTMDWQKQIHSDPNVLGGKPVVKGTRLSADFILELFAAGWTEDQVFEGYPHLTREALRAVFAFAAETTREGRVFELRG